MITHADDADGADEARAGLGPRPPHDDPDPLTVLLRPPAGHLAPPPGRYEAVRRGAARRRLVRTALGAGAACAVAVLVALPLRGGSPAEPVAPTAPMAPPPVTGPPSVPDPATTPAPRSPRPSASDPADRRAGTPLPGPGPVRSIPPSEARSSPAAQRRAPTPVPSARDTGATPEFRADRQVRSAGSE
ncbi:hypothetical protein ACFWNK_24230 [Streptomyces sp. NPDC058417]|uniref:hypothetical protein n=1 Tax=unclassified Streptomyces TaxID=2593676 RepID=UPI00364DFA5D